MYVALKAKSMYEKLFFEIVRWPFEPSPNAILARQAELAES